MFNQGYMKKLPQGCDTRSKFLQELAYTPPPLEWTLTPNQNGHLPPNRMATYPLPSPPKITTTISLFGGGTVDLNPPTEADSPPPPECMNGRAHGGVRFALFCLN